MDRIEIPDHWVNWVNHRSVMMGGKLAKSFGGLKYPMQLAIVDAGFDLRTLNLVIPVETLDENPKTYLEFTTSEQSVLFKLSMSDYWLNVIPSDDRNR
jgi:hypothetical protein